jgi:hypothetical protein
MMDNILNSYNKYSIFNTMEKFVKGKVVKITSFINTFGSAKPFFNKNEDFLSCDNHVIQEISNKKHDDGSNVIILFGNDYCWHYKDLKLID